jgi:hypothetical protein
MKLSDLIVDVDYALGKYEDSAVRATFLGTVKKEVTYFSHADYRRKTRNATLAQFKVVNDHPFDNRIKAGTIVERDYRDILSTWEENEAKVISKNQLRDIREAYRLQVRKMSHYLREQGVFAEGWDQLVVDPGGLAKLLNVDLDAIELPAQ